MILHIGISNWFICRFELHSVLDVASYLSSVQQSMIRCHCHFDCIYNLCYSILHFIFLLCLCRHRYNISWTVDSHTPIEEFKLFYRRLPQGHDIDNSIDQQQPLQHHSSQSHRNYGNLMHWSRNDWRDVVLPSVPPSHHYTQGMSYLIRGLDPDVQYEARVQARYGLVLINWHT